MPRQFFTLKSILTAQPDAHVGNTPVNALVGIGASAILEDVGRLGEAQEIPVHGLRVFDVDDQGHVVDDDVEEDEDDVSVDGEEPAVEDDADEEEIVGAPEDDDEFMLAEEEPDDDLVDDVPSPPPQPTPPTQVAPPPPAPPPAPPPPPPPPPPVARFANVVTYNGEFAPVKHQVSQILGQALNDVMRLRTRAAEAFERKAEEMLNDLACTVLGRELRTERADLANLIAQMRARMMGELPLKIRVSPEDAPHLTGPVEGDPQLDFADLVFVVEDGEIDLRLGTRLAAVLRGQNVAL